MVYDVLIFRAEACCKLSDAIVQMYDERLGSVLSATMNGALDVKESLKVEVSGVRHVKVSVRGMTDLSWHLQKWKFMGLRMYDLLWKVVITMLNCPCFCVPCRTFSTSRKR